MYPLNPGDLMWIMCTFVCFCSCKTQSILLVFWHIITFFIVNWGIPAKSVNRTHITNHYLHFQVFYVGIASKNDVRPTSVIMRMLNLQYAVWNYILHRIQPSVHWLFFLYTMHVILQIVCGCSNAKVLFSIFCSISYEDSVYGGPSSSHNPAVLFLVCIVFLKYKSSTLCPLITLYFYIILCPWRFNYWLNIADLCDHSVPPGLKSGGNIENMHSSVPLNAIMRWKDS